MDERAVYMQGTGSGGCQPYADRLATTALLGYYNSGQFYEDSCFSICEPYGSFADQFHQWWDSADARTVWHIIESKQGLSASSVHGDQAQFLTYVHDWTLLAVDTLIIYSVATSVHNGDTTELKENLGSALEWYRSNLRPECGYLCGCCSGPHSGNVDYDPAGLVDIGDLTALIAYLYIPPNPAPECAAEANTDRDPLGLIDIGDLTSLLAYLYIPPNPPPAPCP